MSKITKRFKELSQKVDSTKNYALVEAIDTVKTLASAKFDETVEIALKLNVDPRHADQMVRGSVVLPAGTGKKVRVAVIAKDAQADAAKSAGADIVGSDDLVEEIQKGNMNFDVLIATPNLMGLVGKVGRILGPKGLMPNPKTGTVTIIHAGLGKVSFSKEQLGENISTFIKAINKHKPASSKGRYIKNAALSLTLSPSISLETQELLDMK